MTSEGVTSEGVTSEGVTSEGGAIADAELAVLWAEIWAWRCQRAPRTRDDLTRLPRPAGWLPDCSSERFEDDMAKRGRFVARLEELCPPKEPGPAARRREVDNRLVGSVLARAFFEIEILASWRRNPWFYLDHSLGIVYDALLRPPPFTTARTEDLVDRLRSIPATLAAGVDNLTSDGMAEHARLALHDSGQAPEQLVAAMSAVGPLLGGAGRSAVDAAALKAADAVSEWRSFLADSYGSWPPFQPIGAEGLEYYLRAVALLPDSVDGLLAAAAQEWDRAVCFELYEAARAAGSVWGEVAFVPQGEQVERERAAEADVRAFYEARQLLSQPSTLRRYLNLPRPEYLEHLSWLGVSDDLGGPDRPGDDAVSYVPAGKDAEAYFYRANALDPRIGIAHEGAHAQQLALSWMHAGPLRSAFFDSVPNEGIAFYNEEMLLQAGLFDDAPATRQVLYNFMRLRALRAEVDLGLALGRIGIEEAAGLLAARVPMDEATARQEAAFFAATPGQGMSYCVGKLQVLSLLADCRVAEGSAFSLQDFHDWLFVNGNVPIALLRYERLADAGDIDRVDAAWAELAIRDRP